MSKEQVSYNYSTSEVLKKEMEIHDLTLESIDKELPNAEAKSLAFTKLIAAVEYDLYEKVKRVNNLVDDIKAFHETRLAETGTIEELNAALTAYKTYLFTNSGIILSDINLSTYHPNDSSDARNYLDSQLNKAAWFSNIKDASTINGFTQTQTNNSIGVYDPRYSANKSFSYTVTEECNIELNEEDHWDGETYELKYVEKEPGTYKPSAYGGPPELQNVPKLVCPPEHIPNGAGVITINKINIKIYGYDLKGENPVEVKESDLNEDTVGIGTFNVLQNIKNTYDVGINTNNSVSFTYDGQTFSGNITEGSTNYNNYLKPKFDEISTLRSEINDLMSDINKMKDMRKKSDLYTWSLKFSKNDTKGEKERRNETIGTFDKFQEKYKDILGFPEPQNNEVTRGKTFKELTEKEKRELSEAYGLGIPKNINVKLGPDKKPLKDPETGEKLYVTDEGFNQNYDEKKLKKFVKDNPGLTAFRDLTVTESGSIIVIDSVGTATTSTGISTQVNRVTSGAMNDDNVGAGASITDQDLDTIVGYSTSNVLPSPASEVGLAVTYSGSIGVATLAWQEGYFDEVVANTFTGAATSVRASAINNTLNQDLPLIIGVGASLTGRADIQPVVNNDLTYNPSTGELRVGVISASQITGVVGASTQTNVNDGNSNTDGVLLFTNSIADDQDVFGDSGIRVNPSNNEIIAGRFTGIVSATDVTISGVSTFTGAIDANGDLDVDGHTELDNLNVSGVSTFVGTADFNGDVDIDGHTELDNVNVSGVSTFVGDVSISDKIIHSGDTDTAIRFPANDTFTVETAGSERFRVSSNGRVGIGTDNLTALLNLYALTNPYILVEDGGITDNQARINFKSPSYEWAAGLHGGNDGKFKISYASAHGTNDYLTITTTGAVGIGTDNPQQRLHLIGDGNPVILIQDGSGTDQTYTRYKSSSHDWSVGADHQDGSFVINKSTNLRSGTPELYISSNGDFGIGTNNPTAKLDVNGDTELNKLNVSGVSTFASNVDVNADLDVDGHTELDNVNVSGVSTFVGTADFNGDVDVDGHTELDNVNVSGVSTFTGAIDANGDLDVDGHTELDNLNVSGVSTFTGAIDANGDLDVDGHTELDNVNVSGVSTFVGNIIASSTLTVGDATNIAGGAPTDEGVLSVYTTGGKNALIIQTDDNTQHRGIAFRNSADAYIGYISIIDAGSNLGDMVFGVSDDTETDVNSVDERLRITSAGLVGIGSAIPTAKLDVAGTTKTQQLNVSGVSTFQGNVKLGDNNTLLIGTGNDLQIYHDGSNSYIADTGTGGLNIQGSTVTIEHTGGNHAIVADGNGATSIHFQGSQKFRTTSSGVDVTGHVETDTLNVSGVSTFQGDVNLGNSDKINLGDGQDLQIFHDGSNNYILGSNGDIILKNSSSDYFKALSSTGAVQINYNGDKKLETTGIGVSVLNGSSDTATIAGPSNLIIDPGVVGDNTGVVQIKGDLIVDGTTTTINSDILDIANFVIGIASTATTDALADGSGLEFGPNDNSFKYFFNGGTNPSLKSSENLNVASGKGYQVNQVEVLNATTLGSSVVNSSLTSVGTLLGLSVTGVATATRFKSTQTTGTAPFEVSSTTVVSNLNADQVDGLDASQFLRSDADDITTGQIQSTKANSTTTGGGQIYLNGATGNRIDFNQNGVAAPAFTTRSAGTKLVLYPQVGASDVDYALGINVGNLWYSVPNTSNTHRWYGGTTTMMSLTNSNLDVVGTITGSRLISDVANGTAPLTVTSTTLVSNLNADQVDGLDASQFLRSDANDTFTGNLSNNGDNYITFGPNSTWSRYLRIGGNGYQGNSTTANIAATNGNLHLDAATSNVTYLNYYAGTAGVAFGNGASSPVAWMGPDGDLWKGSQDNTGSKYWHAGNDGSGTGLDADTVDGIEASSFLRSDVADTASGVITFSDDLSIADKIIHTGDTNTAIRFPSNDTFTVETAGIERLRVASGGDIGIGTSTAQAKLDVRTGATGFAQFTHASGNGGVRISGSAASSNANLVFSNNQSVSTSDEYTIQLNGVNDSLVFRSGGPADTERMVITTDGKIGIGTNLPAAKLHISSGTSGDANLILEADTDNNAENDNPNIIFRQDGGLDLGAIGMNLANSSSVNPSNELYIAASNASAAIVFATGTNNGYTNATERLRITSTGDVGIGTDNIVDQLTLGNSSNQLLGFETDNEPTIQSYNAKLHINTAGNNVVFDGSGNIGIGTDNPGAKLDVVMTSGAGAPRVRINQFGDNPFVEFNRWTGTGNNYYAIRAEATTSGGGGDFAISTADVTTLLSHTYTERIRLKANGNLGIGTNAPSALLNPHGSAALTNTNQTVLITDSVNDDAIGRGGNLGFSAYVNGTVRTLAAIGGLKTNAGSNFDGDLAFYTRRSSIATLDERIRIKSGGNVGINSTAPETTLDIVSDTGIFIKSETSGPANGARIQFSDILGGSQKGHIIYKHPDSSISPGSNDGFLIGGTEPLSVVRIEGRAIVDEKVGIGTNTTEAGLTLYSASSTDPLEREIRIDASDAPAGGDSYGYFRIMGDGNASGKFLIGYNNTHTAQPGQLSLKNADGDITFFNANNSTPTEKLRITSDGDIGIGVTNPGAKLEVNVGSAVTAFDIQGSAGQLFSVTNNLTSGSIFAVNDVSGIPSIDVDADGTILLAPYSSTENVGVGTTNPTAKLDVRGTLNVTGVSTFHNNVHLLDDDILNFGDGNELQIEHKPNGDSAIVESGTGPLYIGSSEVRISPAYTTQYMGRFVSGAEVSLYYANSKKFETTASGINVIGHTETDTLNVSGVSTFQGNVNLGDNDRLRFGDGNDLQIFHDGTDDIISSSGSTLKIAGSRIVINNAANTENQAVFEENGAVKLYYDHSKKFETTSNGATITGTLGVTTINSTTINNSGLLDSEYINVGVITSNVGVTTSGYIEQLSVEEQIFTTDGNTDVNSTFDRITISVDAQGRTFADSDKVQYIAGSPGIGGLTDGQVYYVQTVGIDAIKLYTEPGLVNLVQITPSGSDGLHTFRKTEVGIGTIEKFYSTSSVIKDVNVTGVATVAFSTTTDAFIGVVTTTSITIGSPGSTYLMPTTDGNQHQVLSTDGSGTVSFINPDKFGGNRIYVSSTLGNDSNDGKTAPVKTIKKAAQLAAAESFVYPVTIMVAGGDYKEDNPIILADDVAVVGDNLRRVIVRPQNRLRDCFRVRNGNYITGIVFKDNIEFPTGAGVRHDILDQAGTYAKALVNQETGSVTNYRSITPTTNAVVATASTLGVTNRINELITLTKDSITNESTIVPTESNGNSDQEFTDAATLIIDNVGASVSDADTAYIPGNAVGWSTSASGGNYTLSDTEITNFEKDIHNVMLGIADDLRYGGTSGNEYTLQKIRNIVVGTPSKAFDFIVSFDDPLDTTTSRDGYVGLSSDKPRITQSPYIQNCSIISFLGANGANVDGSKIIQENEPLVGQEAENPFVGDIPDQGKSMVANAFTAVSFGGIGWKVSNAGYAQIVSCFQIFCSIGSYAQSGGYLSITNSATNFGLYALRSTGFRAQAFDFDKGFIFSDGTSGVNQTLRVGGLQRDEQDLYVLRFINLTTGQDQTSNFKQAGITTSLSSSGIGTLTDIIDISGVTNSLADADGLLYIAPSNENQIGGLINDTVYYIDKVGAGDTSANLYFDDELRNKVDLIDVPAGIHTFTKVAEEFFVSEIIEKNNVYQNLTLSDAIGAGVTFVPGTSITQTRSDDATAVGFAVTWTSTVLTVSIENSVNSTGGTERLLFQTTSTASAGSGNGKITDENGTETTVNSVASRSDLHTINFKVDSTISGNSIQSIASLPKSYKCHLHRPSIVNSSAHTWEYAGSGIDYNALPQNGGTANADLEQYNESGGRVFSSGTNELGDFKIGDSITAFNRTGNIEFKNKVTIGQLDSLELSLSSGVKVTEISVSKQLGENELGGPQDSRLSTQAAIRGYLVNRLGSFIDQNKSTAAIPSAVPQLNSQGLLDPGMIPAQIRFNNVFDTNVSGARTDLVNDIPAIEILKSDIVSESYSGLTNNYTLTFENESQFLILSSDTDNYAFNNGDEVIASQNNAVGIVTIPTHPSYGSTGLVKGVINSITVSNSGSGYGAAGIYSGVNLVSLTGSGTSATADVTVDALGEVESVNIRKGGRYYASGDTFRVDASDIGGNSGTQFTATVDNVDTRLYVKLTGEKQQFFASTNVPDFISDGTVASASTDFSTVYTETITPTSNGVGGSVFFPENSILINPSTLDFDTGDPVLYTVSGGVVIGQLENNKTYFVKRVGVSSIQLCESYDGTTIVPLDSSGTGTHQFKRLGVSTSTDFIVFKDHGFTTGQSVKYTTNDGPSGIATGSYYFVGSVTTNGFTLHDVRQDALNSISGSTVNARDLTTIGSGIGTFDIQNVTFVNTVNTSSNNINNFSILVSSSDIDASNIISGVINTNRLASTGTPSDTTFLRGDQKWETAVQKIAVGVGTTSALIVTGLTPSGEIAGTGINTYFGNLRLDVQGITTAGVGVDEYSKIGVVKLRWKQGSNVGPFKVTNSGHLVDLETTSAGSNNNGIDAYSFQGQSLASVVDLSNSTVNGNPRNVLPSANGGTGINNSSSSNQGKVLFCDTISGGVAVFGASANPTIDGTLGVGYFDSNASNTKGILDINKVASHDTATTTTTATTQTSIFSFDKSTFRTGKFIISVTDNNSNEYHSTEMLVIHDGTDAFKTEYGSIFTSQLATFAVDVSGSNVRVLATPASTNSTTFKVYASGLIRV